MCLIVFAHRVHPDYPVIIAANRDEFYARPTAALGEWRDAPNIVAGRDLEEGGTWMGISREGRLAALTNYREPGRHQANAPSRGHLVSDFLGGCLKLNEYIQKISLTHGNYNGYNLIISEGGRWVYYSNRNGAPRELAPGIHGLSNHLLNTPWPKVVKSCRAVERLLTPRQPPDREALLDVLRDPTIPADEDLPRTGVGLEWERQLGAIFIHSAIYGTRSSTVLLLTRKGTAHICERTFDVNGYNGEIAYDLKIPLPEPTPKEPGID